MPASAAAASVTPSRKTVGGTSGTAIGSTGICIADAGRSVTATATCPSNQGSTSSVQLTPAPSAASISSIRSTICV